MDQVWRPRNANGTQTQCRRCRIRDYTDIARGWIRGAHGALGDWMYWFFRAGGSICTYQSPVRVAQPQKAAAKIAQGERGIPSRYIGGPRKMGVLRLTKEAKLIWPDVTQGRPEFRLTHQADATEEASSISASADEWVLVRST